MKLAFKIFVIHLIVIFFTILFITRIAYNAPGTINDEAFLVWAGFLLFDFPCSIIVMVTSGPGVVGVPEFVRGRDAFVTEIFWPGLVFQIVGTINWIMIVLLYRKFTKGTDLAEPPESDCRHLSP